MPETATMGYGYNLGGEYTKSPDLADRDQGTQERRNHDTTTLNKPRLYNKLYPHPKITRSPSCDHTPEQFRLTCLRSVLFPKLFTLSQLTNGDRNETIEETVDLALGAT